MHLSKTASIFVSVIGAASARLFDKPDITVMTQNQYLGVDLTPLAEALASGDPFAINAAIIAAASGIVSSKFDERVKVLANTIYEKDPDLVALQEVSIFTCTDTDAFPGACQAFGGNLNYDHLELTLAELDIIEEDYYRVVAIVQNGEPIVFPVSLDALAPGVASAYISTLDRDVILARHDIPTDPVVYSCARPSEDGCNYEAAAPITPIPGGPVITRGFVAVDAEVNSKMYRFVNTHLEVRNSDNTQNDQVLELRAALSATPDELRLIVTGDINSSPGEGPDTPYAQLTADGEEDLGLKDTWNLRPGSDAPGNTCCQDGNLLNTESEHYERIDVILVKDALSSVKVNTVFTDAEEKTQPSNLWPSDHATLVSRIKYEDE